MALFDFSKFKFFNRMDARSRIFVLVAAVVGISFLIYLLARWISGPTKTTGPSRVANAPAGLQSIPGGTLTPEYRRALMQANAQAAQQAQISGGSAVPTFTNIGGQATGPGGCVICAEQNANVRNSLDEWVRQGKVSPEVAQMLEALADKNVSVGDYAAALDKLVREGKLTPEQARELLDLYKRQHANKLLADSAKLMDDLIKGGKLPLDAANDLLASQKRGISPTDYARMLQDLVRQGKISPETAAQLLAQYAQQRAKEIIDQSISSLHRMAEAGQVTAEVEKSLVDLESRMVSVQDYSAALKNYVSAGKIIPIVADRILAEFRQQKIAIGNAIQQMLQKAEQAAYAEISDLLKAGKISKDTADLLTGMIQKNVSLEEYQNTLNALVQQKKITPEIAKIKMGDYRIVKQLREEAARLADLTANNATPEAYADELKRAVQAGILTPEEAAELMREYQALSARGPAAIPAVPGTEAFAALQQRVRAGQVQPAAGPAQFAAAAVQGVTESAADRQARIDALVAAMSGQAQQLIAAWAPPTMDYRAGSVTVETTTTRGGAKVTTAGAGTETTTTTTVTGAPLIKAGTILFGVLDTAVNSDFPDTPVMVTIVEGKYKGATLLGKMVITTSNTGQQDRLSLNFTLMNKEEWPRTRSVTAYAIDPDTARTVLASSVNYHYLMRFGAMFATSFLQGYASAITQSASTSTTGIFGTSTTHPTLSPGNKLAVGLGQVGQTIGAATQNYVNIPPTVKVDSGVGLGILFMSDVT